MSSQRELQGCCGSSKSDHTDLPSGPAAPIPRAAALVSAVLAFSMGLTACPAAKDWQRFGHRLPGHDPQAYAGHGDSQHDAGVPADASAPDDDTAPADASVPAADASVEPTVDAAPACQPNCELRTCGSDGCDGSCGSCPITETCSGDGQCMPVCVPDCFGRQCGQDACGGTCGSCGSEAVCSEAGLCELICIPDCAGRECGDDACGGTCPTGCAEGTSCNDLGRCQSDLSFADVYAIFEATDCASCHSGMFAAQGLDLSSPAIAYGSLVSVAAAQCTPALPRVDPGNAESSYLINKLTGIGLCRGQRMPRGGPFLSDEQIAVVQAWIEAGAPE